MTDQTKRYYGLPPHSDGRYTIGHEKMHEIIPDIDHVYQKHYEETEKVYLPDSEYEPNYDGYKALEDQGTFVLFTVREYSTVVGYLQYHVYGDMHASGSKTAREDAFFLLPEHRGSGIAKKALRYAENFLKVLGCSYVGMTDKSPVGGAPIGGFLEKEGYGLVAHYYVKTLEK